MRHHHDRSTAEKVALRVQRRARPLDDRLRGFDSGGQVEAAEPGDDIALRVASPPAIVAVDESSRDEHNQPGMIRDRGCRLEGPAQRVTDYPNRSSHRDRGGQRRRFLSPDVVEGGI